MRFCLNSIYSMRNVHFWESPEILSSLKTWFRPRSHSRSQIYETQIYNSRFSNWLLITENANVEFHDCYFVGNLSERCFLIPVHSLDKVKFLSFRKKISTTDEPKSGSSGKDSTFWKNSTMRTTELDLIESDCNHEGRLWWRLMTATSDNTLDDVGELWHSNRTQ